MTDFVLLDLPVFEPVYLPVFELFELKFEPLERPDLMGFLLAGTGQNSEKRGRGRRGCARRRI